MKYSLRIMIAVMFIFAVGCTKKSETPTVWIYTSMYKDTIADIAPQLEQKFPGVKFNFYQAGSEEVAAKVQAENMAGKIQADILITSDRFWYEDLADQGKLLEFTPIKADQIENNFRHPKNFYTAVSLPLMVIAYNTEAVSEADHPKSFQDLRSPKWKNKVSSGSPLASGTAFTTVAMLTHKYGWDYFKDMRKNDFMAEGGNSGVIRRIQNKERPVGIVLMENVLRLVDTDKRLKFAIPTDGAILQANILAIVKKENQNEELLKQVANWMFDKEGQKSMAKSFMYPVVRGEPQPIGAPPLDMILKSSQAWTQELLAELKSKRESIKEEFAKIMFQ
jgi:iron(III) transport system substrate-binding protein